jgi:type I restriction enzyme S subunit
LLVCEGGEIGRAAIFPKTDSVVGFQKALHRIRAIDQREVPRFLYYTLQWAARYGVFLAEGNPNTIPHLTGEKLRRYRFPKPPFCEQRAVADFLDAQTAKLDTLVAKKRELIEELKEKRSALISRTVTRGLPPEAARAAGLNPNPKLKLSGIEWLGEIPEHWEVKQLRYLGEAIIGLTFDPSDVVDENEGLLLLRASNISEGRIVLNDNVFVRSRVPDRLITKVGDILICSRSGSRALIGKNAMINKELAGVTFGTFMTVYRSEYNDFLFYVFNSTLFDYQSGVFLTSTINQLTVGNLNGFEVPLPPRSERSAIAQFLHQETAEIDRMVAKIQEAIERLQEYRTALITAAVTGKIDVRNIRHSGENRNPSGTEAA